MNEIGERIFEAAQKQLEKELKEVQRDIGLYFYEIATVDVETEEELDAILKIKEKIWKSKLEEKKIKRALEKINYIME